MGATYMAETGHGPTVEVAFQQMVAELTSRYEDWDDLASKPGYVQAWPDPVPDCAIEWMRDWAQQNPVAAVLEEAETRARRLREAGYKADLKRELFDKYGPWLMFPLATGGWHFFGWVNT